MEPDDALQAAEQELDQAAAESPMSLMDYGVGIMQLAKDVERQTYAFMYFNDMCRRIEEIATEPDDGKVIEGLPFIGIPVAQPGTEPGNYKLDMNVMKRETIGSFLPLFRSITADVAGKLIQAWRQMGDFTAEATSLIPTPPAPQEGQQ